MVVQAIKKGDIIMEYQYEVKQEVGQTKEEFMHEDQWADSLIKWLFYFFNNCRHTLYCICCCSIHSLFLVNYFFLCQFN